LIEETATAHIHNNERTRGEENTQHNNESENETIACVFGNAPLAGARESVGEIAIDRLAG